MGTGKFLQRMLSERLDVHAVATIDARAIFPVAGQGFV
jgi:hypothetical protein